MPCTDRVVCALLSRAVEAYDKRVPRPRSAPGKHKAARKRLSISFDSSGWFFVCAPLKAPPVSVLKPGFALPFAASRSAVKHQCGPHSAARVSVDTLPDTLPQQ